MTVAERIHATLSREFTPDRLDIIDESHLHAGHAGARPEGETHFRIHIVSTAFESKGRVERHRMINNALADELAGPIHALAIKAEAPGEGAAG